MSGSQEITYVLDFRAIKRSEQESPAIFHPSRADGTDSPILRIAGLLALAIRFDRLLRAGEFRDYAELARLVEESHPYRWICGGVTLNYHTLDDFRVAHGDAVNDLLTQMLAVVIRSGVVPVERIAQDGTRVRVGAGSKSFKKKETLERALQQARAHLEILQRQAQRSGAATARQKAAQERAARERLGSSPAEAVEKALSADSSCVAAATTWQADRICLAAAGAGASIPYLLREGRPVPFPVAQRGAAQHAEAKAERGDLLVLASSGLAALRFPAKAVPVEKSVQQFGRIAEGQSLAGAFAQLVSEWKKMGAAPGARDVLLLAARRL